MGMYNTASAFCGLGKPTIKLEFDSNAALLDFQRKMQGAGADVDDWQDIPSSRETVPAVRGLEGVNEQKSKDIFFKLIESEPQFIDLKNEADNYVNNTIYLKEDSNGVLKRAYKFVSPIENIFCWSDFGHIVKDNSSRQNRTNILPLIKPTIEQPNLIINYEGENYYIKPFITENNEKILFSFIPTLVCNSNIKTLFTPKRNYLYNKFFDKNGKKKQTAVLRYQKDGILDASSIFNGTEPQGAPFKYVELRLFIIKTQNNEKGLNAPGDVYLITDTRSKAKKELDEIKALQKYEVQKFNKEALKDIEEGDPLLFEQLKSDLKGYGDFYTVRDMRKRSKKEPGDVRTNKNLDFTKDDSRKMFNFDKSLYELTQGVKSWDLTQKLKSTEWRAVTVKHETADNKYIVSVYLFFPRTLRHDLDKPTFAGYVGEVNVDININNVFNYHYYIDAENRIYKERIDGFVNKAYYKELFIQAIKNGYKQLQQRLINAKNNSLLNSPAPETEKLIKYYKMLYSDPSKYDLVDRGYSGNFNNIRDNVIDITDGKGVELNGLGAASDALYNNLSILDTRGISPTYQILPSYDQFFKPAEHKNSFAGFGLDDTKQLIADICRKHYKECAKIAAHLKADTLLQSCFNLWHWLHHNIRYEYDREGREEVRTPLRTWHDRKAGVDCDCLSVFAWCVLTCMGYNPDFELVAFNGRPQFSHIFINCDGVVVDRVWFVFNSRPPGVTKREIYHVSLLSNLGNLF